MENYIRIHGRGGQGSFVCAQIIAIAAFKEGYYPYASLFIRGGGDRRGAPVTAFVIISQNKIRERPKRINSAHIVAIQDPSLFEVEDVLAGILDGGIVLINSEKSTKNFERLLNGKKVIIKSINATQIALREMGQPITSTVMAGAIAYLLDFSFESIKRAICDVLPRNIANRNVKAAEKAYNYWR